MSSAHCYDPDGRKEPCANSDCHGCKSVRIAKRWLRKHPLTDAWVEEKFNEKAYSRPPSKVLPRGPHAG